MPEQMTFSSGISYILYFKVEDPALTAMSAMNYFLCYFHFDGIRVDAVSNIVYWDGNKANGENSGSTEFIRRLNGKIHYEHPDVMKIVFVENYGVTLAERIIPASDVSEQISTAGKEASGTSNMKLMMNGAITLGTLDGANVEIADLAGRENEVIFGLTEPQVQKKVEEGSYNPWDLYNSDTRIKNVLDSLINGPWALKSDGRFRMIFDEIMNRGDQYFILADFQSYCEACERVEKLYLDKAAWAHACIMNIAYSGYFSSDRTIAEYNRDIWHLSQFKVSEDE